MLCGVVAGVAVSSPVTDTIFELIEFNEVKASFVSATAAVVAFSESFAVGFVAVFSALLPIVML